MVPERFPPPGRQPTMTTSCALRCFSFTHAAERLPTRYGLSVRLATTPSRPSSRLASTASLSAPSNAGGTRTIPAGHCDCFRGRYPYRFRVRVLRPRAAEPSTERPSRRCRRAAGRRTRGRTPDPCCSAARGRRAPRSARTRRVRRRGSCRTDRGRPGLLPLPGSSPVKSRPLRLTSRTSSPSQTAMPRYPSHFISKAQS